eukprot:symbB.v1.2.013282.t1/scaffold928.1/size151411/3
MLQWAGWALLLVVRGQPWPACPLRGCLPCPDFSEGRPECRCSEGYSLNGTSAGEGLALEWDTVRGWLDSCQPVVCGQLESPAYAEALQDMAETWFFPDAVEYQCSSGYEVEFYGDNWWQSPTVPSNASGLDARLLRFRCSAQGTFENLTGQRCVPVCGDGMLVPIDHLPQNELREQCDDGNLDQDDGCDGQCHVESGFICVGGDRNQPDRCSPSTVSAESSMILSMSGARAPSIDEVSLATLLVISKVFQCPRRDLEILEVAAANASTSTSVGQLHTSRQAMQAGSCKAPLQEQRLLPANSFNQEASEQEVEVYAQFYDASRTERGLVNKVSTALSDCWRPTSAELDKFQGCFAAWSVGRGGLKEKDFRHFLLELDVELTITQARSLWNDLVKEGEHELKYEQALLAYCKVREAPVVFKASKGAAPPGRPLEEIPLKATKDSQFGLDDELPEKRTRPRPRSHGPGLPLPEAEDFLAAEGVPARRIQELLQRYHENGAIPQDRLLNLLEELPGIGTLAGETTRQMLPGRSKVRFRIKISNPQILSLDDIQAEMANPRLFIPKVVAAFLQTSSLQDLYLTVVEVQAPTFQGQVPKVELMGFSDYVALVATVGVSLLSYACLIGLVTPAIYWCLFIMRRPHRLQGHLDLVPFKHKSDWVVGICECCRFKVTCCSLLFFLPARLAYTWDTVGILPYWRGVRQALMCCGLYLMGCWPCGAFIAGQRRSDLKDFLGFGDGVKSNFEVVDICYYLMCPICSVVQEAAHVDMVFAAVRTAVQEEAEKARKRLEDPDYEDEERPAEAPTLQAMLDEGFNAALDTAVGQSSLANCRRCRRCHLCHKCHSRCPEAEVLRLRANLTAVCNLSSCFLLTMKTASLAFLLLVCAVKGVKLATDLSANRSNIAERPACTGNLLERKVGDDHWQCDSLSGDRGTEAEEKCTGSYDTDGTAYSYRFRQCVVRVLSESRFNCLAAKPCEAPEDQHGHHWQQEQSDAQEEG